MYTHILFNIILLANIFTINKSNIKKYEEVFDPNIF